MVCHADLPSNPRPGRQMGPFGLIKRGISGLFGGVWALVSALFWLLKTITIGLLQTVWALLTILIALSLIASFLVITGMVYLQ